MNKTYKSRDFLIKKRVVITGDKGFALISTITIMGLLLLVAFAMLSLSGLETKTTSTKKAYEEARANARMALMMAIAELQKTTGSDTRITAPADAYSGVGGQSSEHVRQLTGVWRSWEGLNHDQTTGKPIAPGYEIKGATYDAGAPESGRFLRWLVSGNEDDLKDVANAPSLGKTVETVKLLADGTLASGGDDEVHLVPTEVRGESGIVEGSFAWWVQGENTKVRLKPVDVAGSDFEASEQMLVSPGPSGSAFDVEDTADSDRALTTRSVDFLSDNDSISSSEYLHDLTAYSIGLQTNVANGGWKRDLSLWAENWGSVPEGFTSFTLSPGAVKTAGRQNSNSAINPLIYSWSEWPTPASGVKIFQNSVSWAALADFATQYKQLDSSGDAVSVIDDSTAYQRNTANQQWEMADTVRRMPVVARVHTVFSLSSRDVGGGDYQPSVVVNPVITVWNPYDVALDMSWLSTFRLNLTMASPFSIRFGLNDQEQVKSLKDIGVASMNLPTNLPSTLWLPGEVRVFSPSGGETVINEDDLDTVNNGVNYVIGCDPAGGIRYNIPGLSNTSGADKLSATEAVLKAIHRGPNVQGTGVYYTLKRASSRIHRPPNTNNMSCLLDDLTNAKRMLGSDLPLTGVNYSLQSLSSTPKPFLTVATTMRYAKDVNDQMENITVNGIHNMNPTVGYMVSADQAHNLTPLIDRVDAYPYNVLLYSVNGYTDPGMPKGVSGDPEGYVGGGFSFNDGASNMTLLEIPKSPLRSIGDLQHFNVNKCNSWAPYTLNALGNSRTSPFIASDKIRVHQAGGGEPTTHVVGHDHSYAFNHVMLDDWFVSSVAPEMNEWSATEARSVEDVYGDFISGEERLPNHYYVSSSRVSGPDVDTLATDFLSDSEAWKKMAAEIEVEGMFNINSTSEYAWEMMLKRSFGSTSGGAKSAGVLTLADSAAGSVNPSATVEDGDGSPFARTMITSDSSAGNFTSLSQPPRFTDVQIEALAREIVVEVKARGPFLSLSEFFNRQLSSDTELANAGAVESALHRLAEGGDNENPYKAIKDDFPDPDGDFPNSASKVDLLGGSLTYPFPKAAEGHPAYGFPGWTRQADVLRPISGILSPRDDTFIIRTYGSSVDLGGKVIAEAWCEAVVSRSAEFMNGGDKYVLPTDATHPYGRRYVLKQFRWLSKDEV